jgi:RNA polymerase primary sigma factor
MARMQAVRWAEVESREARAATLPSARGRRFARDAGPDGAAFDPDPVTQYIDQLYDFEVLDEAAELALASRAVCGDQAARQELVNRNLRLVVNIAKRYRNPRGNFLDLIQEGNKGLLKALDRYNPRLGYRFSTYATWWIKSYVLKELAEGSHNIRMPAHRVSEANRMRRAMQRRSAELGRELTREEIAEAIDRDVSEVDDLLSLAPETLSYESNAALVEGELARITGDGARRMEPEAAIHSRLLREEVRHVLGELNPRERAVIVMRFGLDGAGTRSLEWLGHRYGITRERVRQIEARALQKLQRSALAYRRLKDFYAD